MPYEDTNGRPVDGRPEFERDMLTYKKELMGLACSLTKSTAAAEDLVQDTWVKALSAWKQYTPGTRMKSWLCTILWNTFLGDKRRTWRSMPLDQDLAEAMEDASAVHAEQYESSEQLAIIAAEILSLPAYTMDAVIAVCYLGMSQKEAAAVLDCALGTIKSRTNRGRTLLLQRIRERYVPWNMIFPKPEVVIRVTEGDSYMPIARARRQLYALKNGARLTDLQSS